MSQTPFFISGIKIDGAWAPQFFDQAIACARARQVARFTHAGACHLRADEDYAVGFWRSVQTPSLMLEVGAGEIFGFLGPNGAGKTTTLKLLMRLVFRPPAAPRSPAGPRATSTPGAGSATCPNILLPRLPHCRGTARLFRRAAGNRGPERTRRGATLLDEVGGAPNAGCSCAEFSKACSASAPRRRYSTAGIIFDEPMSGLDPLGRRDAISSCACAIGATPCSSVRVLSAPKRSAAAWPSSQRTAGNGGSSPRCSRSRFAAGNGRCQVQRVALAGHPGGLSHPDGRRYVFDLPVEPAPDRFVGDISTAGATCVGQPAADTRGLLREQVTAPELAAHDRGLGGAIVGDTR